MRKINGQYYFIYSSVQSHELCYAVSQRPDGDFKYGGTIISNGDVNLNGRTKKNSANYIGNNHGSLVKVKDQWYIFYHRQTNRQDVYKRQSLDVLNKYFTIAQMPVVSSTYWNMVHGNTPEEVRQDKEGLQTMRNLARNMAWLLKCIQAGKEQGIEAPKAERAFKTNFVR